MSRGSDAQPLSGPQLDSLVQQDLRLFEVPGIAVGIVKDGRVVYAKGAGVRSLRSRLPVDDRTLFGIASNTKGFTAAALGLLVEEGKIKWDDKVADRLPGFRLYDALATRELTVRDLLCHRSGLATGAGDLMHDPDSTTFSVGEIIYNLRYIKPAYSFRSRFAYDNNLFLVAGELVRRVSGQLWEEFVEEHILAPLKMTASSASYRGVRDRENVIDAHKKVDGVLRTVTRYASMVDDPAGGIYSNVDDMIRWMRLFLDSGSLEGTGFSRRTIKELVSPQVLIPTEGGGVYRTHFAAYGLGWFMSDVCGYKKIFHTGQDVGMVSEVAMIPELGLGIVVLANSETNVAMAITDQIVDGYLGIKNDESKGKLDRLAGYMQRIDSVKREVWKRVGREQTDADAGRYAGTYRDRWFGDVVISYRGGELRFAAVRSPQLRGVLRPYEKGRFVIRWDNAEIDADAFVSFEHDGLVMKSIAEGMGFNFEGMELKRVRTDIKK